MVTQLLDKKINVFFERKLIIYRFIGHYLVEGTSAIVRHSYRIS